MIISQSTPPSNDGIHQTEKNNYGLHCRRKLIHLVFSLVPLLVGVTQCQNVAPSIERSDFVNLNEILKHQQALSEECHRLESSKLAELKQALESKQRQDDSRPSIALKLPAVCLVLNGPPRMNASSEKSYRRHQQLRLDLVNWLYDYDDLLDELHQAGKISNNKTKRQASLAATDGVGEGGLVLADSPLLGANRLATDYQLPNEIDLDEPDEKLFRAQLERMIDDIRFQDALRLDQAKIGAFLSPVILVPGLAGSRLQARISKLTRVNIICKKHHDWQDMWLSLMSLLPIAIDCWIDNVRLEFDPATGFTRNTAGVESRVPYFGSVESVRHLDLKSPKLTKYFDAIIERYIKIGYRPDRNLFAAPYDFRLAPQQIEETFFGPLRQLINKLATGHIDQDDSANERFGGVRPTRRVTLVCHSMGCTHMLVFLRQQSSAWRQTRIRKVVALSSPWGGSIKALKALLVGEQFSLPIVSEVKMREVARTFSSVAYLLPQAEVFSKPTSQKVDYGGPVLVQTPQRNYRVDQMEELLRDVGLEHQWDWFQRSASLIKPMEPLDDVQMDCLHGLNVPTVETIIFRNQTDFPDGDYELVNGGGDGTVNHQSLLVCADWAEKLPRLIKNKILPNVSHTGVLSNRLVLEYLTEDAATN